jgi:signal peptidase I
VRNCTDPRLWHSQVVRVLDRSLSRLPRPVRTLVDWALTIVVAVVAVLVFQAEVAKPYRIPSESMEPTLQISDRVIANRLVYHFHSPERGDIVVFDAPERVEAFCPSGGVYIKRIVGLPGEVVSMRDGHVFVDGVELREPYLAAAYRGRESGRWGRIPAGSYFVLGDNRAMSCDSRRWGAVPRGNIIGRAEIRYWPPDRIGDT